MKPVRDNLAVSPFSDLKELISRNRYKTKTKPYFLWSLLFQSMKLQKCITQESSKEGLHPQCQAFLQWMTSKLSTQHLWIFYGLDLYKKTMYFIHNSFLKNIFVPACFPLDNTKKIFKLLFQLKEHEFSALEMFGAIIHF